MENELKRKFEAQLMEVRELTGWMQREVGQRLGYNEQTFSRAVNGHSLSHRAVLLMDSLHKRVLSGEFGEKGQERGKSDLLELREESMSEYGAEPWGLFTPMARALLRDQLAACGWPLRDFLNELVIRCGDGCAKGLRAEVDRVASRGKVDTEAAQVARELINREVKKNE